jgi:negative regulator of flagellin synthesis FlgM
MKIDNVNSNRITQMQTENTTGVDKSQKSDRENAESISGKDQASFSDDARILAKSRTALEDTPDVRSERVEQLRQEINSGEYQIPIQELAKKFLIG